MNGFGSGCVTPSALIWKSFIPSSSALCVRGLVRLISSARSTLAKIGPGLKTNCFAPGSYTLTPVTSEGSRSLVNWMRWKTQSSDRASAFASSVFPMPGTSSISTCPLENTATRSDLTASGLP